MSARDCGSGCERYASHGKSVYEFYKGLSGTEILDKFPGTARKWVQEIIDASASSVSPSAPPPAAVTDQQNQIAALPARFGSSLITSPPAAANDFITSDSGCCNAIAALASYVVPPKAQSFDLTMVENVVAYTGCSRNEAFESLMQSGSDMSRACEKARMCVSSGRMAALGDAKLVTPYVNIEFEKGCKSPRLLDTGNPAGLVITYCAPSTYRPSGRTRSWWARWALRRSSSSARSRSKPSCSHGAAAACACELRRSQHFLVSSATRRCARSTGWAPAS